MIYSDDISYIQNDNVALVDIFTRISIDVSTLYGRQADEEVRRGIVHSYQYFIMQMVCEYNSEKYKHMANYQSRIFNFDKPNKYREDIKMMKCIKMNMKHVSFASLFERDIYDKYRLEFNIPQPYDVEKECADARNDPYKRNEFIHVYAYLMEWLRDL